MRINDGSICSKCKDFEHECGMWDEDGCCYEYCHSQNEEIRENFYESDELIIECKGLNR